MFGYQDEVLRFMASGLSFFSTFFIRAVFRWRYSLPSMSPTSIFTGKLAIVCEQLAPQGGSFWLGQPRACVEIFGNFEWHYIQAVEKVLIFTFGFGVAGSVVQVVMIDKIFRNTRSAWPQAFIYSVLALVTYQVYINTPMDILPGKQPFAVDF